MTAKEQLKSVREEYAPLRKRIRVLLIVWLVLRAVVLVIEFRLTSLDYIESSDIADSIVAFIFAIFFAFYIDYGYSTVATLPLIGGVTPSSMPSVPSPPFRVPTLCQAL